jgi:hypothetical protein
MPGPPPLLLLDRWWCRPGLLKTDAPDPKEFFLSKLLIRRLFPDPLLSLFEFLGLLDEEASRF